MFKKRFLRKDNVRMKQRQIKTLLSSIACMLVGTLLCGFVNISEPASKSEENHMYPDKKYGAVSNVVTIKYNDAPYDASAAVDPNFKYLAYCKGSKEFFIRKLSAGKSVTYSTQENVYQVKYSPDGETLVAGRNMLDIKSQKLTHLTTDAKVSRLQVQVLAFSPNSKNIAIYDGSDVIEIWDLQTQELMEKLPILEFIQSLDGKGALVDSMAYSPDGRYLVVSGRVITLWDIQKGKCVKVLTHENKEQFDMYYSNVAYSPDAKHVAVVAGSKPSEHGDRWDMLIEIWDIDQGEVDKKLIVNSIYGLWQLNYSPDGQYLAAGTASGFEPAHVLILKVDSGELVRSLEFPDGAVVRLDFNINGKALSASDSYHVRIWNFE